MEFTVLRPAAAAVALALAGALALPAAAAEPPGAPWRAPELADHPLVGDIREAATGLPLTPQQVIDRAAEATYVILGERHDNPDHHAIQAWITRALADRGTEPAVVYEMFETDKQDAIDSYLADDPADASGLGEAVDWAESGWPAWELYQPMADTAVAHGQPILAGNLALDAVRDIARQGLETLDEDLVARLDLLETDGPAILSAMTVDVREGHCDLMPEEAIAPMVTVQRARDAMMAATMREAVAMDDVDQAILITGNGHARLDRGVPLRLRNMGVPASEILVIAPIEVREDEQRVEAYADAWGSVTGNPPFDVVWFTPRMDNVDHCAALRARMADQQDEL